LVIPDCAKAEKDTAASRMESVDLSSMGLSDGFKKKKTNPKFNWYQSDLLAIRIIVIQVYIIQITLASNKHPDIGDLN
jgi:hypothetical protein